MRQRFRLVLSLSFYALLLHGSAAELVRLKLYAFKRYQDHGKYFALEHRFVAEALATAASRG